MTDALRTTSIWADSRREEKCKHASCGRILVFAENTKTAKWMPFDAPLQPVEVTSQDGRTVWRVDLARNHFATCPAASSFRRGRS